MTNEIIPVIEKYRYSVISNKAFAEIISKVVLKENLKALKSDNKIPYPNSKSNLNNG